jgi:hypothetical protein
LPGEEGGNEFRIPGGAGDEDVSVGSGEQLPELFIGDAGRDPRSVVGTGRCMDPQHGSSAREAQAQLRRESGQDIEQASSLSTGC